MARRRRTPAGEGRIATCVRGLLEARGFKIDFFWFQAPADIHYGGAASWGAYGKDSTGAPVSFFSWNTMTAVARCKRPMLDTAYSDSPNSFEVHACEEASQLPGS